MFKGMNFWNDTQFWKWAIGACIFIAIVLVYFIFKRIHFNLQGIHD